MKHRVLALPEPLQNGVLHFAESLLARSAAGEDRRDDEAWWALSLQTTMRGLEDEELGYSESDLTERFT